MQIGSFLCSTDKFLFRKTSATLSAAGFTAIMSTGLPCFFFCAQLLFCIAALLFGLSANGPNRFFNFNYFLAALPFFLFSMFFMFMGVLSVFCFTVVLFFSVCMFNVLVCFYVFTVVYILYKRL